MEFDGECISIMTGRMVTITPTTMKNQVCINWQYFKGIFCLALIVSTFTIATAQEVNPKEMVGFACGFAGESSDPVNKLTRLLRAHRYDEIAGLLTSGTNAERFLAVISIEKLASMGRYRIGTMENKQIESIKASHQQVSVCSGCTYFAEVSLSDMFTEDNFIGSDTWITGVLK